MNHQKLQPSFNSSIVPFLLGATASLSIVWIWQQRKAISNKCNKKDKSRTSDTSTLKGFPSKEKEIFDHENLSHRMLRKAEAVIQWRTRWVRVWMLIFMVKITSLLIIVVIFMVIIIISSLLSSLSPMCNLHGNHRYHYHYLLCVIFIVITIIIITIFLYVFYFRF